jgi:hypothetical protein
VTRDADKPCAGTVPGGPGEAGSEPGPGGTLPNPQKRSGAVQLLTCLARRFPAQGATLPEDWTDYMNSRSGFVELGVTNEGLRAAPIVSETYWGYVIRPAEPCLERAALVEILATFSGILVFLAAYGQWLLPGSDLSISVVPLKLVSTVIFVALGATLVWIGRMGMVQELHVDRVKAELRLVQRNRLGHGRLVGQIAFAEVSSVVLLRSRTPVLPSRLSIRLAGEKGRVDLLPSDEEQLLPIRDRLISDLSPRFRAAAPAAKPRRTVPT